MATPPWKSVPVGLPDDGTLNAVSAGHTAARREEVRRLVADREVYEHRLDMRRAHEYEAWVKIRGKWCRRIILNAKHAGSAAVNEGSVKAIRTTLPEEHPDRLGGLPERPSVPWLRKIDSNTAIDQQRVAIRVEQSQRPVGDTVTDLPTREEIEAQRQTGRTPKRRTPDDE